MDSGILVWFICFIPIITTIIFYVLKPHEFVWWEVLVPIFGSLAFTLLFKVITDQVNVMHKEVWGSNVVSIYESEPWNEWVSRTCQHCSTDSDGNRTCTDYDCSYQDDHGPSWYIEDDLGETHNISEHHYDSILNVWGGIKKVDHERRNHSANSRAHWSDGTKFEGKKVGRTSYIYKSVWNRSDITRIPHASTHKYENRVQAGDATVFDIKVVTEAEADTLGLFKYNYPEGGAWSESTGIGFPTILSKIAVPDSAVQKFKKLNGKFGPSNRMRLWVLVFKDAPPTIGHYQENYWVKGNFNEFVICVSVDRANIIQWAHVFSWTLTSELPVEARNAVLDAGVLNKDGWNKIYNWLNSNLGRYEKRSHEEFSYIKVTPPTWAIILNLIITTGIAIGINFWASTNEEYDVTHEKNKNRGYWNYRRY